jgi:hypothetical protein
MLFTSAMACLPQRKSLQPASGTHTSALKVLDEAEQPSTLGAWFLP